MCEHLLCQPRLRWAQEPLTLASAPLEGNSVLGRGHLTPQCSSQASTAHATSRNATSLQGHPEMSSNLVSLYHKMWCYLRTFSQSWIQLPISQQHYRTSNNTKCQVRKCASSRWSQSISPSQPAQDRQMNQIARDQAAVKKQNIKQQNLQKLQ